MFVQPAQDHGTILCVKEFATDKQALDFIAGKIAAEAEREGSPLSEVERKMLYFSETEWTLPDLAEASAEFDRDYNQNEYERKIATLVRKITAHHNGNNLNEEENWNKAIARLSEGDHYILVLVNLGQSSGSGFLPTLGPAAVRPPHDVLKLVLTALAVVFGLFGFSLFAEWLRGTRLKPIADWVLDRGNSKLIVLVAVFGVPFLRLFWPELKGFLRAVLRRKQRSLKVI
jgi:hypothetical protein